ncbi:MAG: cysteine desulfurase family protein [Planctomycetota bacterium]
MRRTVYLDHHATTPVDPRVLEAMLPCFTTEFGNAASRSHRYGWEAEKAAEEGRARVAALIGADPREIVFTSGATESNNLAIRGLAYARRPRGGHLVSAPTEHPSVLESLRQLQEEGFQVTLVPVDRAGRVRVEDVEAAIREETFLLIFMAANNEVGTLHPIRAIGELAERRGILFHTDATQAVGKVPFDVRADRVHLASLTGHKMHGPKGCGALYVRRLSPEIPIQRLVQGGAQERGVRPGTLNVPGAVGLGMAAEICRKGREEEARRVGALRDRLKERLFAELDGLQLNGDPERRLPGNLHVSFAGVEGDALMLALPELALSTGSACASGSLEPSHVLKAMGVRPDLARSSLRFGLGRSTTEEEIDFAAARVIDAVRRLRRG